jgi:hypothetical protein
MLNVRLPLACLLIVAGCSVSHDAMVPEASHPLVIKALIDPSAAGWDMKVGPEGQTILLNQQGRAFNVGHTQYPDISQARLYKCAVKEFGADFLVLYVPPIASGGSRLTLFTILAGHVPVRVADITTHCESWDIPEDWKQALFADSDGDGVLELCENDAYRWSGTVTYYAFDGQRFFPLWIEEYKAPEHDDYNMQFVSRRKVQ